MKIRSTLKTFTVVGFGPFPVSMLRFDCAWPYTDEDANRIEHSLSGNRIGKWAVELQTSSNHAPTIGRWESFNITVQE